MKLLDTIRSLFHRDAPSAPPTPSKLRNKPGGMAWIAHFSDGAGSEALARRAVMTVCVTDEDFWQIDPPQTYTLTGMTVDKYGHVGRPGDTCSTVAIRDSLLIPWREDDGSEDESHRYLPPLPAAKTPQELVEVPR